jgi:N-acetylneuraminate synthase
MRRALIIAEAGVNHNGSLALAIQLVDAAIQAKVDIVKFQTYITKNLVTEYAKKADYQSANSEEVESQEKMLSRLELSFTEHLAIKEYCELKGIEYLSTAFDSESLYFLVYKMRLKRLKIPSGEITNSPFILEHAQSGCDLILSTGMSTLEDITTALGVIAFGFLYPKNEKTPSEINFSRAFNSEEGKQKLIDKVTLLHCTTEYPAPFNQVNLAAMELMKETFHLSVGYSDHTEGIVVPVVAVANGACIIEKHFTLSRTMSGPDHKASIEPDELIEMVKNIRICEQVFGDKIKQPSLIEQKNKIAVRKSIVAKTKISVGELFSEHNIIIKRPGSGISPSKYWQILGEKSVEHYNAGDLIKLN